MSLNPARYSKVKTQPVQKVKEHQSKRSLFRAQRKFRIFPFPHEPEQFPPFQMTVMRLVSSESEHPDGFRFHLENSMPQPEILETVLKGTALQVNGNGNRIHAQRDEILVKMLEEIKEDQAKVVVLIGSAKPCFWTI